MAEESGHQKTFSRRPTVVESNEWRFVSPPVVAGTGSAPVAVATSTNEVSSSSKKRARIDDSDANPGTSNSFPSQPPSKMKKKPSRAEKKRQREKQRRTDVTKGFDALLDMLFEVDPALKAEAERRAHRVHPPEDPILSRSQMIHRAAEHMKRIHEENENRKLLIARLMQAGARPSKSMEEQANLLKLAARAASTTANDADLVSGLAAAAAPPQAQVLPCAQHEAGPVGQQAKLVNSPHLRTQDSSSIAQHSLTREQQNQLAALAALVMHDPSSSLLAPTTTPAAAAAIPGFLGLLGAGGAQQHGRCLADADLSSMLGLLAGGGGQPGQGGRAAEEKASLAGILGSTAAPSPQQQQSESGLDRILGALYRGSPVPGLAAGPVGCTTSGQQQQQQRGALHQTTSPTRPVTAAAPPAPDNSPSPGRFQGAPEQSGGAATAAALFRAGMLFGPKTPPPAAAAASHSAGVGPTTSAGNS